MVVLDEKDLLDDDIQSKYEAIKEAAMRGEISEDLKKFAASLQDSGESEKSIEELDMESDEGLADEDLASSEDSSADYSTDDTSPVASKPEIVEEDISTEELNNLF